MVVAGCWTVDALEFKYIDIGRNFATPSNYNDWTNNNMNTRTEIGFSILQ